MINIYTDGAYSSKRNQGGWAFVVIKDGKKKGEGYGYLVDTTNNICELTAIKEALKDVTYHADIDETVYINTDSKYCIGVIALGFKRNKNVELLAEIDEIKKSIPNRLIFNHVKGHSTNEWNNYCDEKAVEMSQRNE